MSCSMMAKESARARGARSAAVVTGRSALRLGVFAMLFTSLFSRARRLTNTKLVPPGRGTTMLIRLAQTESRPERLPLGENGRRCGCCRGLRKLRTLPYASLCEEATTICRRPMTDAGNFPTETGKSRNQVTRRPRRSLGDHEIPEPGVLPSTQAGWHTGCLATSSGRVGGQLGCQPLDGHRGLTAQMSGRPRCSTM